MIDPQKQKNWSTYVQFIKPVKQMVKMFQNQSFWSGLTE